MVFEICHIDIHNVDDVVELADAYRADSHHFMHFPYNRDRVREHVVNAVNHPDHFIVVAYIDGLPIGGFWGYAVEQIFSPIKFGHDAFSFVLPRFRSLGVGAELVKAAEAEFKLLGATCAICGANSGIDGNSGAIKMYQNLGYTEMGRNLIKSMV